MITKSPRLKLTAILWATRTEALSRHLGLVIDDLSTSVKAILIRAIGLSTVLFKHLEGDEQPKPLILHSRKVALARCAVHILPAAVSITILYFNFRGYFIGAQLQGAQNGDTIKLAVLQVCAKAQVTRSPPPDEYGARCRRLYQSPCYLTQPMESRADRQTGTFNNSEYDSYYITRNPL